MTSGSQLAILLLEKKISLNLVRSLDQVTAACKGGSFAESISSRAIFSAPDS